MTFQIILVWLYCVFRLVRFKKIHRWFWLNNDIYRLNIYPYCKIIVLYKHNKSSDDKVENVHTITFKCFKLQLSVKSEIPHKFCCLYKVLCLMWFSNSISLSVNKCYTMSLLTILICVNVIPHCFRPRHWRYIFLLNIRAKKT